MAKELVPRGTASAVGNMSGASTDEALIELFLRRYRTKSRHSAAAYEIDVREFRKALPGALARVSAKDLLDFQAGKLTGGKPPHRRRMSAVKSLFKFGMRTGYLRMDPASIIELPKGKDTLVERLLTVEEVARLFLQSPQDPRKQLLVRFLYGSGARIEEAINVRARDLRDRGDGRGQVTLFGKRQKTRAVLLPAGVWKRVRAEVPVGSTPATPLFRWSVRRCQQIVKAMATAAGLEKVSPHWLRHAHGSHAAMRKVPAHIIRDTLGHSDLSTTTRYIHAMPDESSALALEDE